MIFKKIVFLSLKIGYVKSNSADPDETSFGCPLFPKVPVSGPQMVKIFINLIYVESISFLSVLGLVNFEFSLYFRCWL